MFNCRCTTTVASCQQLALGMIMQEVATMTGVTLPWLVSWSTVTSPHLTVNFLFTIVRSLWSVFATGIMGGGGGGGGGGSINLL